LPFSKVKYGVITKEKLLTDLLNWDYLYVSGRMHKPTVCIGHGDDEILRAQKLNIKSALAASLLLLNVNLECDGGRVIPASEIFSSIAQLSYAGDFRMTLGAEDKNKVKKLVQSPGQYKRWVELYNPPLQNLRGKGILDLTERNDDNAIMVRCDLKDLCTRRELVNDLPKALQQKLYSSVDKGSHVTQDMLSSELVKIVSKASRVQGIKGLFTAGISKSIKYSVAKFSKGILRK
jgi:translocator assembly and maintenance protein 41